MIRNVIFLSTILFIVCCGGNVDVVNVSDAQTHDVQKITFDSGNHYDSGDIIASNGDAMTDAMISDK